MQNSTQLGMSLGRMLTGAFDGTAKQKGRFDAEEHQTNMAYKQAAAEKAIADADKTRQEISFGSDDSLMQSLLAGIGANSEAGQMDFKSSMAGNYKPLAGPPTAQQDMAGNNAIPVPSYVGQFPELQQKYAGLKQMLALGDKSLPNLAKSIQGDQRNAITRNLTADNAADIGLQTAAIEGNVNPLEMIKASLTRELSNSGSPNSKENALLLSQGKTRFDNMGGTGTFDLLTGLQSLNELGKSGVNQNNAQAAQAYAGATENKAQANLANTRGANIKAGKGDGSATAQQKDFAQIRDDIRGDYNAAYPLNFGERAKGAPDFNTFTKQWLQQYNIDENAYFRSNGTKETAPTKAKSSPQYQEYINAFKAEKDPARRKRMTEFARQKGIVK